MLEKKVYDVVYVSDFKRPIIQPHFCREFGCYGTNKNHGFTWEEARDILIDYYEKEIEYLLKIKSGEIDIY